MPIIQPSSNFQGSDAIAEGSKSDNYIKSVVRKVTINKTTNTEGVWLYLLPPYKADAMGNGVWFKVAQIRADFGDKFKEKYYVDDKSKDPASYFETRFKQLYPDLAKVSEETRNGYKFKIYPAYGRITKRAVYNVALAADFSKGVHILDLPVYNGADQIHKWISNTRPDGSMRQLPCLPDAAAPVFVKLNSGGGGNPWQVELTEERVQLPPQLADTDYLYNLDDIFETKSPENIVSTLRECFPMEIFNKCMEGYDGPVVINTSPPPAAAEPEDDIPMNYPPRGETLPPPAVNIPPTAQPSNTPPPAPAVTNIPKPNMGNAAPPPAVNAPASNPMGGGAISAEEAMRMLQGNG